MDKYEYKVRSEQIKVLISEGEYAQAAQIADTIDWRRVRSMMMLCKISDLYKINRRYEDARDLLLLAYDRRPGARAVCYALCELSIKMEDIVQAVEYYKEFVQVAPRDTGRYILQYKLYEAQEVSLEERIAVLEELKRKDYREKWAYELAYLYHRVGLATRCVEECDELILWFGEGKYVIKAMELKMLHEPLTPQQQYIYDNRYQEQPAEEYYEESSQEQIPETGEYPQEDSGSYPEEGQEMYPEEETSGYPEEDMNGYPEEDRNGYPEEDLNGYPEEDPNGYPQEDPDAYRQEDQERDSAEGGEPDPEEQYEQYSQEDQEFYTEEGQESDSEEDQESDSEGYPQEDTDFYSEEELPEEIPDDSEESTGRELSSHTPTQVYGKQHIRELEAALREQEARSATPEEDDMDIQVQTMDVSQYNTINLQKEIAEGLKEVLAEEAAAETSENMEESGYWPEEAGEQAEQESEELPYESEELPYEPEELPYEPEELPYEPEELPYEPEEADSGEEEPELVSDWQVVSRGRFMEGLQDMDVVPYRAKMESLADHVAPEEDEQDTTYEDIEDREEESEEAEEPTEEEAEEETAAEELEEETAEDEPAEEEEAASEEPEETVEEETAEEKLAEEEEAASEEPEEAVEEETAEEKFAEEEETAAEEKEEAVEEAAEEKLAEKEKAASEETEALAEVLSMDMDGQIRLVMPQENQEESQTDDQIPGQLSFEDLLLPENFGNGEEAAEKDIPEAVIKEDSGEEPAGAATEKSAEKEPSARKKMGKNSAKKAQKAAAADQKTGGDAKKAPISGPVEREKARVRDLTHEEKELFDAYIQDQQTQEMLVKALDAISLAAYTGNVVLTGDEGLDTYTLAKNILIDVQLSDTNFSGRTAKITGASLNKEEVSRILGQLTNGAIIIQKASGMDQKTVDVMYRYLQQESVGIIVILEDNKRAMNKFLAQHKKLAECFNARIDLQALDNEALAAYGRQYAKEQEYSIDEFGMLALHTRIQEMQSSDHAVSIAEVKEIVDEAIRRANRKTVAHFCDVLLAKRYDDEDMVILREKDFAF